MKALVTMAGPDVICVGAGKESQEVLKVNFHLLIYVANLILGIAFLRNE